MNGQRFDRWTRSLVRATTRRRAIGGAAGAAALLLSGFHRTRAQEVVAAGEACSSTEDCSQLGGPTVCADNGLTEDGALNCCRIEAGACARPADCCGALDCVDGFCVGDSPPPTGDSSPPPTGESPAPTGDGLALGAVCTETSQCAASSGGTVVCGNNGIADDGPLNCCLDESSACSADSDCCGSFYCTAGVCGSPDGGDLAPGEFCVTSTQCSQNLGPAICDGNGFGDGSPVCCLRESSACSNDQECCGLAVCADNAIMGDGGLNCCGNEGAACTVDAGCCADLFCLSGTCQPLG